MSTVAENCWVMQIKKDQLITQNIKKCHIILYFRKQIKGNDSQWLETTFKYLVRYSLGEIIVCNARSLHARMTYSCYSWLSRFWYSARFPGVKTFWFSWKSRPLLAVRQKFVSLHHDQKCPLLPLALTMFVPSNTARSIPR